MFLPRSSRTFVEFSVYLLTLVLRLVDAAAVAAVAGLYVNDDGMHARTRTHTDARCFGTNDERTCVSVESSGPRIWNRNRTIMHDARFINVPADLMCVCVSVKLYDDDESRHKTMRAILRDRLE